LFCTDFKGQAFFLSYSEHFQNKGRFRPIFLPFNVSMGQSFYCIFYLPRNFPASSMENITIV